ncbi:MAG: methionine--tRNA ligase [Phycisphaerae bacterium]
MSTRKFLITAALPYSNGRLHVGNIAGAYLPADIYVRYLRATGAEVRFICGSDDNGVAAVKTAREQGKSVEELTAYYNASQRRSFAGLGIEFDIYGGTHQPECVELHEKICRDFFLKIHAKGFFTKKETMQLYDTKAEQFLPDRFVKGTCPHCGSSNAFGDQCEGCGKSLDALDLIDPVSTMTDTRPEPRQTIHWYLRLDQLQERLATWLTSKRDAWRPTVVNFALGQLQEKLPERAMTRDLSWGVPVPLDDPDAREKVLYVWFDAPIGYISFTAKLCELRGEGWQAYEAWWKSPECKVIHFIGEDNTVFHALTFPAMMLATHDSDVIQGEAGEYQLADNVVANAFLNIKFPGKEEEKISKSRGTAVWIEDYLETFDPDPLRYYLTANAPETQRTAFDFDDFINRNNTELLNALGNFVNRTMTFAHKYFDGKVPPAGTRQAVDDEQIKRAESAVAAIGDDLERCRFKAGLSGVMQLARDANVYFDTTAPFRSRKTDMEACGRAINVCLQTVRTLTTLMAPFLPASAQKCLQMLHLDRAQSAGDGSSHPNGEGRDEGTKGRRDEGESSIVNPQSAIVNRQSSIVNRQSSIVNRQSSIVNPQSSAGSALLWSSATNPLPDGAPLGAARLLFKKLDPQELFGD